jgi:serine phosphatase RsbU (regulator of sigma subunit)
MSRIDLARAMRQASGAGPAAMPEVLAAATEVIGGTDVTVYLVDFGQTTLEPLPDRAAHAELPTSEPVASSMAGRAFTEQRVVTAERDEGVRVWAPVVEGSDRTGVLALSVPAADDDVLQACADLGLLAGYLIAAQARCTDMYNLHRRRRSMSLAASMQWDLLPPLVLKTPVVTLAGLVEPAYDVGGDCFDYAANGTALDLAVMDAMGHGTHSALLAGLAMGAYRHARREARPLAAVHEHIATAMAAQYPDASFVTGVVARLATDTGELTWTNAGHPCPLLIRGGRVISELRCDPTPPWGLGSGTPPVASASLEPGDSVLFYTDGVIEARTPDLELFGLERLSDLTQSYSSDLVEPEEIVRRLVGAVLDHQRADLRDDATLLMVRWNGSEPTG